MRTLSANERQGMRERGVPEERVRAEEEATDAIVSVPPALRGPVMRLVSCRESASGETARQSVMSRKRRIAEALALRDGLERAAAECRP